MPREAHGRHAAHLKDSDHRDFRLQEHKVQLGITDVQLRLTPLEEVFTTVASQAEVPQQTNEAT